MFVVSVTQWGVMVDFRMGVGIWAVKTHKILEKNKDENGNWDPCYVLAKNLALLIQRSE